MKTLVPMQNDDTFGKWLDFKVPEGCEIVVLCRNEGFGHIPVSVLLPHQIEDADLKKLKNQFPDTQCFTVLPVNGLGIDVRVEKSWPTRKHV